MVRIRTSPCKIARISHSLMPALFCVAAGGAAFSDSMADSAVKGAPDAQTLLNADKTDGDWLLPAKSYLGNRFSGLTQITPENVATLRLAWSTPIVDDSQQEASPIVNNGTMYISTPHNNVLALDAGTGKL